MHVINCVPFSQIRNKIEKKLKQKPKESTKAGSIKCRRAVKIYIFK